MRNWEVKSKNWGNWSAKGKIFSGMSLELGTGITWVCMKLGHTLHFRIFFKGNMMINDRILHVLVNKAPWVALSGNSLILWASQPLRSSTGKNGVNIHQQLQSYSGLWNCLQALPNRIDFQFLVGFLLGKCQNNDTANLCGYKQNIIRDKSWSFNQTDGYRDTSLCTIFPIASQYPFFQHPLHFKRFITCDNPIAKCLHLNFRKFQSHFFRLINPHLFHPTN